MNPLEVLGEKFEDVKNSFSHTGIQEVYDFLEEGDEQEYFVSAPDGSWQLLLERDNRIRTIFLFMNQGYPEFQGIRRLSVKSEILGIYGNPTKFGEQTDLPVLGKKGAWERFDFNDYVLHIEHEVELDRVAKITVMMPSAAP